VGLEAISPKAFFVDFLHVGTGVGKIGKSRSTIFADVTNE
jgi:hypothetical protein